MNTPSYNVQTRKGKSGTSYRINLNLGKDPITGKYLVKSKTINGGTKREAERAAAKWADEVASGLQVDADKVTLGEYMQQWHGTRVAIGDLRRSTLDSEETLIRSLSGYIGEVKLAELNAPVVRRLIVTMRDDGLSDSAVCRRFKMLKQILKSAVNDDVILRNPCDKVDTPRVKKKTDRKSLSIDEATRMNALLDALGDDDSRLLGIRLGLATGMRVGEVLGLTWGAVDLDNGTVHVVQQSTSYGVGDTKTESSKRRIAIDPGTCEHLQAWRRVQKMQLAALWVKQDGSTPVITDETGGYHDTKNYERWFKNFCVLHGFGSYVDDEGNPVEPVRYNQDGTRVDGNGKDAQGRPYSRMNKKPKVSRHYKGLRFHELRHTQATLLLANGVDIKTVSARLGHSTVALTLDLYAHAVPENDRAASDTLASLLQKPRNPEKAVAL